MHTKLWYFIVFLCEILKNLINLIIVVVLQSLYLWKIILCVGNYDVYSLFVNRNTDISTEEGIYSLCCV